jgi:acyl-CoA thioesterase-1
MNLIAKLVLLTSALMYSGIASPGEPAAHKNNDSKRIVCFGNSITAGYGVDPTQAYPAVLQHLIDQSGKKYEVINAGLSGDTSADGLSRIDWILRQPVDIFLLELGGNDGLRGLSLDETLKNLQAIIDKVEKKYPEAKIVIAGMKIPPNMGETYTHAFEKIYPELAQKNKVKLIPFLLAGVGGDPELNQPDGIHPNVKGHRIVAQNVYNTIKELL